MKINIYVIITLVAVIGFNQRSLADNKKPQLPADASADWYTEAIRNIEKSTYRFQSLETKGFFRAVNSKQHLAFRINPEGYAVQVVPGADQEKNWTVSFSLKGIGRNGRYTSTTGTGFEMDVQEEKLTYLYPSMGIEYLNDPQGMRQNFRVNEKP